MCNVIGLTVEFTQQTYTIHEDQGSLQVELILSSPSSYHITVTVLSTNGSATGTYIEKIIIWAIV